MFCTVFIQQLRSHQMPLPCETALLKQSSCTVQEPATDPKEEILYIISCKALV